MPLTESISVLLGFLLTLILYILFVGLFAAAVDHKCGGSYDERYRRFVVTAWGMIWKK
jgi:hypothetical protein